MSIAARKNTVVCQSFFSTFSNFPKDFFVCLHFCTDFAKDCMKNQLSKQRAPAIMPQMSPLSARKEPLPLEQRFSDHRLPLLSCLSLD